MAISSITLVGANGTLGPSVLSALLAANFSLTVLSRPSSKSIYPDGVNITHMPEEPTIANLIPLLQGQDAVITTFYGTLTSLQITLAEAAAQADVKRFIPADFGSCDSSSPLPLATMELYRQKKSVRDHLEVLSARSNLTWSSIICGHFFDFGLKSGLLGFDLKTSKARIFDDGDRKWSASTLERVGEAVVGIFKNEEETKNKLVYVQSFCISQNALLGVLENVTGKEWRVEKVSSEAWMRDTKEKLAKDPKNGEIVEDLVSVLGIVEGNWEEKEGFANAVLGLQNESLEKVVRKVIEG